MVKKRRRRKRRYKIKNILSLFLVLFIIVSVINFISDNQSSINNNIINSKTKQTNKTYLNKITNDENFNGKVNKELENKIIEYMDTYFKAMTTLKEIDMTNLFSNNSYEEAYINQTAISTLINIRKLERNDMTISNAKYDIIYKDIVKDNNEISVTFLENDYLHFNFMKNIESKVYGVENTIVFKLVNDSYKIIKVRKIQDFYIMITDKYETGKTKEEAKNKLNIIKNEHISDYKKQVKVWKAKKEEYEKGKNKPTKKCANKYNRKEALDYAKKYVKKRNPKWMKYDDIGGNCQNYASQVLYTGGIPMDTIGDASLQWKHYSSEIDESSRKAGRSSSWTTAPYFYDYAKNNTGYGLCSITDINPFYAEEGDIGQVGFDEYYRHSVVIIGNIKNKDNEVVDLLINSNSTNLENYPLSGYVYPYKRIIKIFGWNRK